MTPAPSPDVAGLVERDTVCAGDKPYTNGIRDLAEMPHVSEQLGNVFRDCAHIIDARNDRIETLEAALREVFEEWAGSEGFIPETAPEAYLLQLTKRMADIARAALEAKQ